MKNYIENYFKEARIGDKVVDIILAKTGKIEDTSYYTDYPIRVVFNDDNGRIFYKCYTIDGRDKKEEENLVEEISEILVVRIEDAYINLDSIPDRDFFKNDEKLKEFLYSGAIYFGNDNIDSIEVPIGHYIAFNENKDTDNIYYLRNSHSLIYDIDYLIGFKNERSKYFECLKKCIGKIND